MRCAQLWSGFREILTPISNNFHRSHWIEDLDVALLQGYTRKLVSIVNHFSLSKTRHKTLLIDLEILPSKYGEKNGTVEIDNCQKVRQSTGRQDIQTDKDRKWDRRTNRQIVKHTDFYWLKYIDFYFILFLLMTCNKWYFGFIARWVQQQS